MAWDDLISPGAIEELPFFTAAALAVAALLAADPVVRWGSRPRAVDRSVPVEFVARPPSSPDLAPAPAAEGERAQRLGPGAYRPAQVRAGPVHPAPKPAPRPKPAKLAPPRRWPPPARKAAVPASRPRADPAARAARQAAIAARRAAALVAAERAREEAARKAAALEAARKAALAQRRREEAARRAAAAKAAALRRAAEAARKAELSRELATMADPDETLGSASPPAAARASISAPRPTALKAGAAAALDAEPEPAASGGANAAGAGGADELDASASGGGSGPDGSGVSWKIDGPVGRRRALTRVAPTSPDWVGSRGLDLLVTVRFRVLPDGSVKPGAVIQKTSGFPKIDRLALKALSRWRFEPAPGAPETWGRVSFRFTSS